jgi:hypothetical protein
MSSYTIVEKLQELSSALTALEPTVDALVAEAPDLEDGQIIGPVAEAVRVLRNAIGTIAGALDQVARTVAPENRAPIVPNYNDRVTGR